MAHARAGYDRDEELYRQAGAITPELRIDMQRARLYWRRAHLHQARAELYQLQGNHSRADEELNHAEELAERMRTQARSADLLFLLFTNSLLRAELQVSQGALEAGRAILERADALLVGARPDAAAPTGLTSTAAFVTHRLHSAQLGYLRARLLSAENPSAARVELERIVDENDDLAPENARGVSLQRIVLRAQSRVLLGYLALQQRHLARARRHMTAALSDLQAAVESVPDDWRPRLALARAWAIHGQLQQQLGRAATARASRERAAAEFAKLSALDPSNAEIVRVRSKALGEP